MRLSTTKEGDWVLIRNEEPQKFEAKWFGPYKVLKTHPLGTYALGTPTGRVLRNLIHGNRLVKAHTFDADGFWASSGLQSSLKRAKLPVQRSSPEVDEILEQEEPPLPSYEELSTISRAEWDRRQKEGLHKPLVGEGENLPQEAIRKTRKRHERVNPPVPPLQNVSKAHRSVAPPELILTEVGDVMDASQETIESRRDADGLAPTPMTEERRNREGAEVPAPHGTGEKPDGQKRPGKGLQQRHNESKSKRTSSKAGKEGQKASTPVRIDSGPTTARERNTGSYNLHERPKKKALVD